MQVFVNETNVIVSISTEFGKYVGHQAAQEKCRWITKRGHQKGLITFVISKPTPKLIDWLKGQESRYNQKVQKERLERYNRYQQNKKAVSSKEEYAEMLSNPSKFFDSCK